MKNIILAILSIITLIACENDPAEKIISLSKEQVLELIDTIAIDINGDLMGEYLTWSISEDNYIVAYHHWLHKIDVFNLSNEKFSHSIRLENQGPNEVGPLSYVVKIKNEYFASSGSNYYRISPEGLVLDKRTFRELSVSKEGFSYSQNGPHTASFDYFSLDQEKYGFFQPIYKFKENNDIDFLAYFMCFIDYINWESTYILVNYPASFIESHSNSIALGDANMIRYGSFLIFNFPSSNDVFELDTHTGNLKTHSPNILNKKEMKIDISEYGVVSNSANSIEDAISWGNAQMLSPRFLPIKYDEINNVYYRMHKTKVDGLIENGANMFNASFFLIKMDNQFNTLTQYELGNLFNPKFQVHDGYLYFTPTDVDKTALHFLKIYRMKP